MRANAKPFHQLDTNQERTLSLYGSIIRALTPVNLKRTRFRQYLFIITSADSSSLVLKFVSVLKWFENIFLPSFIVFSSLTSEG